MPFNTTVCNNLLNYFFGYSTTLPTYNALYIGLCSNDPEADGGTFTELSGSGYARVVIVQKNDRTYPNYMQDATERYITNKFEIHFKKATAAWPTAVGFGIFSAETGGTPIYYAKLDESVTVPLNGVALLDPYKLKIGFADADVSGE